MLGRLFNIHLTGNDANLVKDSKAQWDEVQYTLTIKIGAGREVPKNTMLSLSIQEAQGFILPANLHENDPRLRVSSVNNIQEEPILMSPMVGDGPYPNQKFCVKQYEKGTHTSDPFCPLNECFPKIYDPCNVRELARCDCTLFGSIIVSLNN